MSDFTLGLLLGLLADYLWTVARAAVAIVRNATTPPNPKETP